jgi:hypothetical protein
LTQKVWIERTDFRIEEVNLFHPSGKQEATILLGDYHLVEGISYPFSVKGKADGKQMEIVFKELKAGTK